MALGYLGHYRPEKGHRRLLAAAELVRTRTPWRVDLAGFEPLRGRIATEIEEHGLTERVSAGRPIADIGAFFAEHDIAVLLSDDEGSPNALIEAALLGRPLIGADAGGTREVLCAEGHTRFA